MCGWLSILKAHGWIGASRAAQSQAKTGVPVARGDGYEETFAVTDASSEEAMAHLSSYLLRARNASRQEVNISDQSLLCVAKSVGQMHPGEVAGDGERPLKISIRTTPELFQI